MLLIVESPIKVKYIQKIVGDEYIVKSTCGHLLDLGKSELNIDIDKKFEPNYTVCSNKANIIKQLKKFSKNNKVIIATDADREGEFIAYSIEKILQLQKSNIQRVYFTELTSEHILESLKNTTSINYDLVNAQMARRMLDRLIGYKISPMLWEISNELKSVGRVQSVILRLIVERENDISEENIYPKIENVLKVRNNDNVFTGKILFDSNCTFDDVKHISINKNTTFKYLSKYSKEETIKPPPPYITSTLQQDSYNLLNFTPEYTMNLAQYLFEKGLITYIRTDSYNMSNEFRNKIKNYIFDIYGNEYYSENHYKNINQKYESHECIRPTNTLYVIRKLPSDEQKLYSIIFNRTIKSQMSPCVYLKTTYKYLLDQFETEIYSDKILSSGYKITQTQLVKNNEEFDINNDIIFEELRIVEDYTKHLFRYSYSTIINKMESCSIGRPSTYSSIIKKLLDRKYIICDNIHGDHKSIQSLVIDNEFNKFIENKEYEINDEKNKLRPTILGYKLYEFIINNYNNIFNIDYTTRCESYFDNISIGRDTVFETLSNLYNEFSVSDNNYLGSINSIKIYKGWGKYGPYVKANINGKYRYASIKGKQKLQLNDMANLLNI